MSLCLEQCSLSCQNGGRRKMRRHIQINQARSKLSRVWCFFLEIIHETKRQGENTRGLRFSKVLSSVDTTWLFKNLVTNISNVSDIVIYKVTCNSGIMYHCQKKDSFSGHSYPWDKLRLSRTKTPGNLTLNLVWSHRKHFFCCDSSRLSEEWTLPLRNTSCFRSPREFEDVQKAPQLMLSRRACFWYSFFQPTKNIHLYYI